MHGFTRTAVATALLAALAGHAAAPQPTQAQRDAIRGACRNDYMNHCANVPSGGAASLQCLQQNAPQLSPPCQQALASLNGGNAAQPPAQPAAPPPPPVSRRQEAVLLRRDCGPDYRHYCADVQPGGGRAIACLIAHDTSLSQQCRSALLAARETRAQ
jgi:hypothetical protein